MNHLQTNDDATLNEEAFSMREVSNGTDTIAAEVRELIDDYFTMVESSERLVPITLGEEVPATKVLAFVSGLLRGANIELFELGMWQSWSGLKR